MNSFLGLVKNEYIKILKKKSTLVIFILVGLFSFGLAGLVKLSLLIEGDVDEIKGRFESYDYTEEINSAEQFNNAEEKAYYTYLQDNKINVTNWKKGLADAMFGQSGMSDIAMLAGMTYSGDLYKLYDGFIKNSDWKGYYEFLITALGDSDAAWGYRYRIDNDIAPEENSFADDADWRNAVADQYIEASVMADMTTNDSEKQKYLDIALTAKYRLEHDVSVNIAGSSLTEMTSASGGGAEYESGGIEKQTLWTSFSSSTSVVNFIGLLIIIIAGGIVASEFSNGTIKFLLINPRTRGKILASKYVTVITIGYIMIVICYIMSLISSLIFFGASDIGAMYVQTSQGVTKAVSGFVYIFERYMIASIQVIVITTFAFAISSVVKSSSLAIGLGIFALEIGGNAVTVLKMAMNIDAVRYTIFANADLLAIANGQTIFPGQTLGFAIVVIVIHMAVFLLTAWDGFVRRDV